jgi:hypothetical protein
VQARLEKAVLSRSQLEEAQLQAHFFLPQVQARVTLEALAFTLEFVGQWTFQQEIARLPWVLP